MIQQKVWINPPAKEVFENNAYRRESQLRADERLKGNGLVSK